MTRATERGSRDLAVSAGVVAAQRDNKYVQCRTIKDEGFTTTILSRHVRDGIVSVGLKYKIDVFVFRRGRPEWLETTQDCANGGYDLMGLTKQQVIDDVLERYEAHLAFLTFATESDIASVLTPPI